MMLSIATIPASMNVAGDSLAEAGVVLSILEFVSVAVVSSPVSVCIELSRMVVKVHAYNNSTCWFMP